MSPTATPAKNDETAAPAQGQAGKHEWASLTAVITGISVFAFGASSYFVLGVSDALNKQLAIYFSTTDYIRITPSWLVPSLGVTSTLIALAGLAASIIALIPILIPPLRRAVQKNATEFAKIFALTLILSVATMLFAALVIALHSAQRTGESYARFLIQEAPLTRVLFESEKDQVAAVEGRVIFDIEPYL